MEAKSRKVFQSVVISWLACFLYVLMEWLFFATRPSIFSYYSLLEKLSTLFLGSLILFCAFLPLIFALSILTFALEKFRLRFFNSINFLIPATLLAGTAFLLVDNFTYTMFGIYSGSFSGIGRYLYGVVFLLSVAYFLLKILKVIRTQQFAAKSFSILVTVSVMLSAGFGLLAYSKVDLYDITQVQTDLVSLPNIMILSSDGINARNMSAYGYERETTPFIETLVAESLVFENHFTNAANTTGSVTSLLTGKLPTTTKVIYPPDTLRGVDAYEHLPGILRKLGYQNADISIDFYADSEDLNMQEAFQYINGRSYKSQGISAKFFSRAQAYFPLESLFLRQSYDRISSRLFYISGLREMANPYTEVTFPEQLGNGIDDSRVQEIYQFIRETGTPFFMHVHLMGSHGRKFRPKSILYSQGQVQSDDYMLDFYDDSIRDFDNYVREIVGFLKERNIYEDMLLIINTDHGMHAVTNRNLPLIMKFPGSGYRGSKSENTQRIDIAPTILEYLNIDQPDWMEGDSLISLPLGARRNIFASSTASVELNESGGFEVFEPKSPFYTLGRLSLIDCHMRFEINLVEFTYSKTIIEEHTQPCGQEEIMTGEEVKKAMIQHLIIRGYELGEVLPELNNLWPRAELFTGYPKIIETALYIPVVLYQGAYYSLRLQLNADEAYYEADIMMVTESREVSGDFEENTQILELSVIETDGRRVSMSLRLINLQPIRLEIENQIDL